MKAYHIKVFIIIIHFILLCVGLIFYLLYFADGLDSAFQHIYLSHVTSTSSFNTSRSDPPSRESVMSLLSTSTTNSSRATGVATTSDRRLNSSAAATASAAAGSTAVAVGPQTAASSEHHAAHQASGDCRLDLWEIDGLHRIIPYTHTHTRARAHTHTHTHAHTHL